jgi:hypothetical protein
MFVGEADSDSAEPDNRSEMIPMSTATPSPVGTTYTQHRTGTECFRPFVDTTTWTHPVVVLGAADVNLLIAFAELTWHPVTTWGDLGASAEAAPASKVGEICAAVETACDARGVDMARAEIVTDGEYDAMRDHRPLLFDTSGGRAARNHRLVPHLMHPRERDDAGHVVPHGYVLIG